MNDPALILNWEHRLRRDVDRTIAAAIARLEAPNLRHIIAGSTAGGKRVRPLLAVLACMAAGGREAEALPAAAAVELLHASSLIHDDIMDNADTRRGGQAVHKKHGIPAAILAGDALIAIAFRVLQNTRSKSLPEILSIFSTSFLQLCEGQWADIECSEEMLNDPSQHRWMVERKTAKLLDACMRIGALIATDEQHVVDALGNYGLHLGLAYQAMDDLLDATGDESGTGKSVGLDQKNGRHTYLTLAYPATDVLANARAIVSHHTAEALSALEHLPETAARDRLAGLARRLLDRRD
jgi:geranylgeranyl diphosphate synthase, type I